MKKIITIVLLSLSCFYCSAQELQTTKKENIYTVIPNVENLFVLMNCTLDQFESTMKKYKYYERNSRGTLVTYWNGESLDAHLANAEINWFSYFAGNTNNKSIVCQIVIPKSGLAPQSSANLLRQVRPFYQKNADAYCEQIADLTEEYRDTCNGNGQKVVLFHEGLEYAANEWNLNDVYTLNLDEERQVSAGEVADVLSAIQKDGAKMILAMKLLKENLCNGISQVFCSPNNYSQTQAIMANRK
jgi:hypothetical protein